jgi:hypothetical protein
MFMPLPQAIARQLQARKALVLWGMQEGGTVLAMPGTIQNQSGWYEMYEDGASVCMQLRVTKNGGWEVVRGPLSKAAYNEAKGAHKQWEQRNHSAVEAQAASEAAVVVQSKYRQLATRAETVRLMATHETLLAMPGTIQNQTGWYEMFSSAEDTSSVAVHFGVKSGGDGEEAVWEVIEGPIPKSEWVRRSKGAT